VQSRNVCNPVRGAVKKYAYSTNVGSLRRDAVLFAVQECLLFKNVFIPGMCAFQECVQSRIVYNPEMIVV